MATLTNTKIKDTYDGLLKTTDNEALDVSGVTLIEDGLGNASALSVGRSGNGVSVSGNLAVDTNTLYVDATNNRVGIGTSSPTAPLQVERSSSGWTTYIKNTSATSPSGLLLSGGDSSANFAMYVRNAAETSDLFAIKGNGNVGIGTSTPEDMLHLVTSTGTAAVKFDGNGVGSARIHSTFGILNLEADDANENAASYISFSNHGSERMRIDSSGRVGIGTSSPTSPIDVVSDANATGILLRGRSADSIGTLNFADNAGNVSSQVQDRNGAFWITTVDSSPIVFNTAASERMRIDSSGNVIAKAGTIQVNRSDDQTQYGIFGQDSSGGYVSWHRPSASLYENFRFIATNTSGSTERMRIDSSGNVQLQTVNAQLRFQNSVGPAPFIANAGTGDQDLYISTGGSESMRIDSSGNVGIGTSSPSGNLHISDSGDCWLAMTGNSTTYSLLADANGLRFFTGFAGTERMRITSGGNVLVGTTSVINVAKFSVDAGSSANGISIEVDAPSGYTGMYINRSAGDGTVISFDRSGSGVGSISVTGSSTAYNTSSDYRLKENVVEMTGALDRVDALKPSRFNFIGDEKTVDGFLAHEVAEVVPEAVTGEKDAVDEEGNPIYQGIDQSKIVPLLVGAIKELRAEIELLKAK